jgi:hypothetical protein
MEDPIAVIKAALDQYGALLSNHMAEMLGTYHKGLVRHGVPAESTEMLLLDVQQRILPERSLGGE